MKPTPSIVSLLLLTGIIPCAAQAESNPFIRSQPGRATGPTGAPFISYTEHLLVDPSLLDDWLEKHPLKEDASALREQLRQWTAEGKATLDQIGTTHGVVGRTSQSNSITEQIYPTEYDEQAPGTWPLPTAFTTYNIGLSLETGVTEISNSYHPWATIEYTQMTSTGAPWNAVAERTRQPGDLFFPQFRSIQIESIRKDETGEIPSKDPFAAPSSSSHDQATTADKSPLFTWDTVQLAGRFEPLDKASGKSRVIFFRGYTPPERAEQIAIKSKDISRISFLTIKVATSEYSAWLAQDDRKDAWATASSWLESGIATRSGQLSSIVNSGRVASFGNTESFIYPTEWIPMAKDHQEEILKHSKDPDRIALTASSSPTSFEERHLGVSILAEVMDDEKGALLAFTWSHVAHTGTSICRRYEVAGEWVQDARMPVFAARNLASSVRLETGKWIFAGQTASVGKEGQPDLDHCLLVFAMAE